MPRTDSDQIAAICEVDSSISLTPFITVANELVTEVCGEVGYTDDRLTQIETWLAAHFYCVRDPRAMSESVSGVSESKQMFTGPNLQATMYGQTAMALDTNGGLSRLSGNIQKGKGKQPCTIKTLMKDDDRAYYGV